MPLQETPCDGRLPGSCANCGHAESLHRPHCLASDCSCSEHSGSTARERLTHHARDAFEHAWQVDPRDSLMPHHADLSVGASYHVGAELAQMLDAGWIDAALHQAKLSKAIDGLTMRLDATTCARCCDNTDAEADLKRAATFLREFVRLAGMPAALGRIPEAFKVQVRTWLRERGLALDVEVAPKNPACGASATRSKLEADPRTGPIDRSRSRGLKNEGFDAWQDLARLHTDEHPLTYDLRKLRCVVLEAGAVQAALLEELIAAQGPGTLVRTGTPEPAPTFDYTNVDDACFHCGHPRRVHLREEHGGWLCVEGCMCVGFGESTRRSTGAPHEGTPLDPTRCHVGCRCDEERDE